MIGREVQDEPYYRYERHKDAQVTAHRGRHVDLTVAFNDEHMRVPLPPSFARGLGQALIEAADYVEGQ